ncbi:MAG: hemolysin family protein [Candidatus Krumholzibacteria bacterium]|nr:hemolysin family protein [Candidatus Krumholzibacteria bacterium]
MFWEILFVLFLVAANGFFVAAEFALVKIRLSELKASADAGSRSARLVEDIVGRLDAYLSACQLGITLASLGLGWVGEPLVAAMLEPLFHKLGIPVEKTHYIALPLAFATITFLHITAGEQVPKILAIRKYQPTSFVVSLPLAIFYKVFRPFIWILNSSSNLMLRAIGIRMLSDHGTSTSEDELRLILLESAQSGHVSVRERLIMENVLDLEDKSARSAMLPRNQIEIIDRTDPIETQLQTLSKTGHTRLPLCDEDLEHVVGIVHIKDIFGKLAARGSIDDLTPLARPATFFPENMPLDRLLRELQRTSVMMGLLVDEYGVVSGLITLENVIEELVGPIQDEFDSETPLIVQKGTDTYEVDATCPIDEVRKRIALQLPELEADTIGGAVIEMLGSIPKPAEELTVARHKITVIETSPRHIIKLLIAKTGPPKEAKEEKEGDR